MHETPILAPSRHPFQLFILTLCLITGVPVLVGNAPAPGSLEDAMPDFVFLGWNIALVAGSAVALVGSMVQKNRVTGILLEQWGLVAVGMAAIVYGILIPFVAHWGGAISASIIFGFGVACLWRWWQLQKYILDVQKLVEENGGE